MSIPLIHEIVLNDGSNVDTYVLDMDVSCDESAVAVASAGASNNISLFDPHSGNCIIQALSGHNSVINSINFALHSPSQLISASDDQTVCLFDCRESTRPSSQLKAENEVHSAVFGMDDNLIAIGSGQSVVFFDARNLAAPLGAYADCHSDTILKLKFHPSQSNILHSSGEDGLICSYDTGVAAEEDAVLSICNTESPVRQVGHFGSGNEGIYGISTVETVTCWHYPSSQRIGEFTSIREDLGADYVIDCWGSKNDPNSLCMAIGGHSGQTQLCWVDPSGLTPFLSLSAASESDPRGHSDTIRCCKKIECTSGNILLTAGEDSKICIWRLDSNLQQYKSEVQPNIPVQKNINRLEEDTSTENNVSKRIRRL